MNVLVRDFLRRFTETAMAGDHPQHMAMISRKVRVFGVPGFEVIGYDDWHRQCAHEFAHGALKRITFEDVTIKMETGSVIAFEAIEVVEAKDGSLNRNRVEIFLEEEEDGQWRLVQERILASQNN
jgi:ketosteroid isomerase-like protein